MRKEYFISNQLFYKLDATIYLINFNRKNRKRCSIMKCIQLKNNSEMRDCDECENGSRIIGQNL